MTRTANDDIASLTAQRDRARAALGKICGIVVALGKGIGSQDTALAAIQSIRHVKVVRR